MGVKAERDIADAAHDECSLLRLRHAHGDIGLAVHQSSIVSDAESSICSSG